MAISAILAAVVLSACGGEPGVSDETSKPLESAEATRTPNFLVLIGDDMAVETLGCYGVGSSPASTPRIDSLCDTGMRFDNFWSQPVCSPTRASILTGQYGFRNGVGTPATGPDMGHPIPDMPLGSPTEFGAGAGAAAGGGMGAGGMGAGGMGAGGMGAASTVVQRPGYVEPANARPSITRDAYGLPRALAADKSLAYQSAAVGKWHLGNDENGALDHPAVVGFDHYAGNFNGGAPESYFAWSKVVDGKVTDGQTGYATTETVNDALAWLNNKDPDRPWLLWVAFNAPHSPYGPPPSDLVSEATAAELTNPDVAEHTVYAAMIEAMDTEIARLLDAMDPAELANTYVIFLGDNGTPDEMTTPPFTGNRAKGTVYQGGVNVPFVITGPGLEAGAVSQSLANSVDLYATILDLAGTGDDPELDNVVLDAVSLAPVLADPTTQVRSFAYADVFGATRAGVANERAIRDERFKLVFDLQLDTAEFYDLLADPYEKVDLLQEALGDEAQAGFDALVAQLEALCSADDHAVCQFPSRVSEVRSSQL
jgi:arylsulfatase A-like enzyme